MAKEVVAWCDKCSETDLKVQGSEVEVALGGRRPLLLDLCEDHVKELIEPLVLLLQEHGQPSSEQFTPMRRKPGKGRPIRTEGPGIKCPFPDCPAVYGTRAGVGKHLHRDHDSGIKKAEAMFGPVQEAMDEAPLDDMPKPYGCPTCEATYATPQGLGAHRSRAHGYKTGDDNA